MLTLDQLHLDPVTGTVTGFVDLPDPESTATLAFGFGPHLGEVTVNADGSFVYTPNMAGRLRAGTLSGGATDRFGVKLTGPAGATFTPITVPVRGARLVMRETMTALPSLGRSAAVSPDGSRLYITDGERFIVLDTADNTFRTIKGANDCGVVVVNPTGSRVYVAGPQSSQVVEYDAAGMRLRSLSTGTTPFDLAVSPDGSTLFTSNLGGSTVTATDLTTGRTRIVLANGTPWYIELSRDGRLLYAVTTTTRSLLRVLDLTSGAVEEFDCPTGHLAVSSDDSRVFTTEFVFGTTESHWLRTLDRVGDATTRVALQSFVANIALTPDGSLLFIANPTDSAVLVVDTATQRVLSTLFVSAPGPFGLALTGDGRRLYAACDAPVGLAVIDIVDVP